MFGYSRPVLSTNTKETLTLLVQVIFLFFFHVSFPQDVSVWLKVHRLARLDLHESGSLESPLKGHQPLYFFYFLFLILNI